MFLSGEMVISKRITVPDSTFERTEKEPPPIHNLDRLSHWQCVDPSTRKRMVLP